MNPRDHSPYLARIAQHSEGGEAEALIADAATSADLPDLKRRWALTYASLATLPDAERPPFDVLADLQTRFADATIARALALAWAEQSRKLRLTEPLGGLFVLGLGKLGGGDLNFSSDVDLVAFYDAKTFPVPPSRGQAYEASQILKRMSRILQPAHEPDFVWRVDWRLRPEASARGLAMDVEAAREFYFFRALPWHRLALIKARPVAGDLVAGRAFLDSLEPWLWRRNLDFRALDELASIKSRINQEHPGLQAERAKMEPITSDPTGFNLKLGTGGIREIEFIANAAQLIWGGKRPGLRTPNTLQALATLGEDNLLPSSDAAALAAIYKRLRRLENAVQMHGNAHTHLVPEGEELQHVMRLARDDLEGLEADRRTVNRLFRDTFVSDTEPPPELPRFVRHLSGEALAVTESWAAGFGRYGVRDPAPFAGLAPELLWRIHGSQLDPETAIARIDTFFANLSRSEQYLRLLARHPQLLEPLITPLLHSPHMADLLAMSPHIIDVFLSPADVGDTRFVLASEDQETRLDNLRRFVNEQLYRAYFNLMSGQTDEAALQAALTRTAEAALDTALTIVADDLGLATLPVSVIALGKLGLAEMMPLSDIDLLFLFPDSTDSELAARIVRRLRTVLTTPMREGIVYELDMRLRPSGRAGPPAVKWSQFVEHHNTRARTWEHLALQTGRHVAGNAELGGRAERFIADIVARPRDRDQLVSDAARMWARIAEQRLRDTPHRRFDARLRPGGLLQAEFTLNTLRLLGEETDMLKAPKRYFSAQLIWERLLGLTLKAEVPEPFAARVPHGRTGLMAGAVERVTEAVFAGVDTGGDDQPVRWS